MSRNTPHIFTSESVGEGHPDKVADYISDSILDACLAQDKTSRVACETLVKSNMVIIAGELTTKAVIDPEKIARQAIREIGYCNRQDDDVFHADTVFFTNLLTEQSPDIAQGVDALAIRPTDSASASALLEAANQSNIPVFLYDTRAEEGSAVSLSLRTTTRSGAWRGKRWGDC